MCLTIVAAVARRVSRIENTKGRVRCARPNGMTRVTSGSAIVRMQRSKSIMKPRLIIVGL